MPLNEADTRAKLIDPALHACGWTENLIRREETAGAIEIIDGKPRKRARGRVKPYDFTGKISPSTTLSELLMFDKVGTSYEQCLVINFYLMHAVLHRCGSITCERRLAIFSSTHKDNFKDQIVNRRG